jgi:ankyrin repeat protein
MKPRVSNRFWVIALGTAFVLTGLTPESAWAGDVGKGVIFLIFFVIFVPIVGACSGVAVKRRFAESRLGGSVHVAAGRLTGIGILEALLIVLIPWCAEGFFGFRATSDIPARILSHVSDSAAIWVLSEGQDHVSLPILIIVCLFLFTYIPHLLLLRKSAEGREEEDRSIRRLKRAAVMSLITPVFFVALWILSWGILSGLSRPHTPYWMVHKQSDRTYKQVLENKLFKACFLNMPRLVGGLVQRGADVDFGNGRPMSEASRNGHHEVVQALFQAGAKPKQGDAGTAIPPKPAQMKARHDLKRLLKAVSTGNMGALERLIGSGVDLDFLELNCDDIFSPNPGCEAVLIYAAVNGHAEAVRILVKRGANVNIHCNYGVTPLMCAACNGKSTKRGEHPRSYPEIVEFLAKNGADVHAKSRWGSTALMYALGCNTPSSLKAAEMLLKNGADINAANNDGRTALIQIAGNYFPELTKAQIQRSDQAAAFLLDHGANVNLADKKGETALMRATVAGRTHLAELLLAKGADIDARDKRGWTALMWGCRFPKGSEDVLDLLIKKGADLNARSVSGSTALYRAAFGAKEYGSGVKLMESLLKRGADPNIADKGGKTLLMALCDKLYIGEKAVDVLIRNGADVNARDNKGMTPLMYACDSLDRTPEVLELLLNNGAQVNARDKKGNTPLMYACNWRELKPEFLELLLKNGALVDDGIMELARVYRFPKALYRLLRKYRKEQERTKSR